MNEKFDPVIEIEKPGTKVHSDDDDDDDEDVNIEEELK
jgi:hypothetical protein